MSPADRDASLADHPSMTARIAEALRPVPLNRTQAAAVGRQLALRVRRSAAAQRDHTTVRREDSTWAPVLPGVAACMLQESGGMRIQLLQLDALATLACLPGTQALEVLVIEGNLCADHEDTSISLCRLDHVVLDQASPVGWRAGPGGARLYVRSRLAELDALPPAEARWWIEAQKAMAPAARGNRTWSVFVDDAEAVDLQTHGAVASMLLRIGPGATLPDHGHALHEDCFMIEGDMFLGDILIRAGDYQLARAGGEHVRITSDRGGVFYFHGALPDSAIEVSA